jgi:hypothetical protein
MKVIAAAGLKVPTEANPRQYITDDANDGKGVEIEPTAYYLRRLADNELVEVGAVQADPTDNLGSAGASSKAGKAAPK